MSVFASNWWVGLRLSLTFVFLALGWAVLQSSDRRLGAGDVSFRGALVSGVLFAAVMTGWKVVELVRRRKNARRAIGPRFDTDRRALAEAMRTGELPADPTLDEPLLAAISFRRVRTREGPDLPAWVGWAVLAASVAYICLLYTSDAADE